MNRREFIKGAMVAVAASYAGGIFILDNTKLIWRETFFDYNRFYGMSLEFVKSNGDVILNGLRMPIYNLPMFDRTNVPEKIKTKMKQLLLEWLEKELEK